MNRTIIAAVAASISTLATPAFAETVTMKPIQGVSFDIGGEYAVAYFTSKNAECNVVVARAGEPNWKDGSFSTSRFEAKVSAGKSVDYDRSTKFLCASDAQSMIMERVIQIAKPAGQ